MIGDSVRDIEAGAAAGLRTLLLGMAAGLAVEPDAVAANAHAVARLL